VTAEAVIARPAREAERAVAIPAAQAGYGEPLGSRERARPKAGLDDAAIRYGPDGIRNEALLCALRVG
jgi:hypothetical protein